MCWRVVFYFISECCFSFIGFVGVVEGRGLGFSFLFEEGWVRFCSVRVEVIMFCGEVGVKIVRVRKVAIGCVVFSFSVVVS